MVAAGSHMPLPLPKPMFAEVEVKEHNGKGNAETAKITGSSGSGGGVRTVALPAIVLIGDSCVSPNHIRARDGGSPELYAVRDTKTAIMHDAISYRESGWPWSAAWRCHVNAAT
jgi:hypothetical protein